MENIKKRALDYLQSKPELKELYGTQDGFLFEQKHDATTHARTLNETDPNVIVFEREKSIKGQNAEDKKSSLNELKAVKAEKVKEYTSLFGEEPDKKLTATQIEELIKAKREETATSVVESSIEQAPLEEPKGDKDDTLKEIPEQ